MKKQSLLLLAGGMLAFAACNTENTGGGMTDAQIDSTVNARVDSIRMQMMLQNDSLINAMAMMKADSMMAAMNTGGSTGTTRPSTGRNTGGGKTAPQSPNSGGVNNRPGATNGKPAPVTNRPGATNNSNDNKPKPVTDRPGAN